MLQRVFIWNRIATVETEGYHSMKPVDVARKFRKIFGKNFEYPRYLAASILTSILYPKYTFSEFGTIWREDKGFMEYYRKFVSCRNYRSFDRRYTLNQLAKLTLVIKGDTAECGVFEGASSYLICKNIIGVGKTHHIFDSFEGLSTPSTSDGTHWMKGDFGSCEERCRKNLREFSFIKYHKGWIPETFCEVEDKQFSFVHVDVDLYQPTLETVAFFYPRLNKGSIMLFDDYGFSACPGAKKAIDEFFDNKSEEIIMLTTGQAFTVKS
jgi:hypothetical protein